MSELAGRLTFDCIPFDSRILVRLHVCGPFMPRPQILEKLMELLRSSNEVMTLAKEFSEDERILLKLQRVLAKTPITPTRVSGVHYGSQHGHSVHVEI